MKTRDKILYTSLALFNEEGEPNVTTVDIAAEINISPGNLYYHFKGKASIICELYEGFEVELVEILNTSFSDLSVQDSWIYMYVLFERIYAFRFFYQNQRDILHRVPEIAPRFKRLLNRKFRTASSLLMHFREAGVIQIDDDLVGLLSENIVLLQAHWLNYLQFRASNLQEDVMLHRGVFQMVAMIAPYLTEEHKSVYHEFQELYLSKAE